MKQIPTAEEFLKQRAVSKVNGKDDELFDRVSKTDLVEFAKLHVEAALYAASEQAKLERLAPWEEDEGAFRDVDRTSILKAYPLTNIK
jgi:hypothetical protein